MTDNNEANKALIDEATIATPAEAPPGFPPQENTRRAAQPLPIIWS